MSDQTQSKKFGSDQSRIDQSRVDQFRVDQFRPLADRMRPTELAGFFGQTHLLGPGKPLRLAIESGKPHSMVFWGPPGTGKTTLARLIAAHSNAEFIALSAVTGGVKEVRSAVAQAQDIRQAYDRSTIVFLDEVHRFNKSQQDAFLPFVENGTFVFIGATTENPSFELNNALLSRARVYVLRSLAITEIEAIIDHALQDKDSGFGSLNIVLSDKLRQRIAEAADGDARRALNVLEIAVDLAEQQDEETVIDDKLIDEVMTGTFRRFDKGGEAFYDQISALHKSVRGSSPDAALYWMSRMLDGGCDPLYIARRVVRMASEDIGNADPRALTLALDAWQILERLGSPEGELALAQAVTYLASAAKSNAVYTAFNAAQADAKHLGSLEVPLHLRNAPTRLMKDLDYGKDYHYPHDAPDGYIAGEQYFPDGMAEKRYYQPTRRGLEQKIAEKLDHLRMLDADKRKQS